MLGVDGREVIHLRFRIDTLALSLPKPLFKQIEEMVDNCIFRIPSWRSLIDTSKLKK
jgi:hypothetical protein